MKKNKKIVLICTFICLIVIGTVVGIIMYLRANTLTVNEKKWIDENSQKQTLLSINVLKDNLTNTNDSLNQGLVVIMTQRHRDYKIIPQIIN